MGVGAITLKLTKGVLFMKELFKNKLFIVLSLFIILITFISSSCFASYHSNVDNNSIVVSDGNGYEHTITLSEEQMSYPYKALYLTYVPDVFCNVSLVLSSSPFYFKNYKLQYYDEEVHTVYYYDFSGGSSERTFTDFSNIPISSFSSTSSDVSNSSWDYSHFSGYSTVDIYDTNDNLVFQAPPHQVEAVTIPAIQQVEEIPQGMTQVLQVIIPIGLIVLSIGLVIYLMRLVIYRMK